MPAPGLPKPPTRRLRVYGFDPHAALDLESAKFSYATISLAWEDPAEAPLLPGPVNEYLEVIDVDPCNGQFYEPVDLNAPELLAQDGLPPSERDPRFHQQMVFAVAMKTIRVFERALGRKILWAKIWNRERKAYEETPRLRIYPHALREANAYYSREKRALLFGYFNSNQRTSGASWVFTCLSHDIIVHETTHAILDGLHPRYAEPTSPDSLAFHEAFADIAALFSHFQLKEAVSDFIARFGGGLDQTSLLSGLAGQFARGVSGRPSLRDFIDKDPRPEDLAGAIEPHDRGAILVAAVFDAFLSIYTSRTADLFRIANTKKDAEGHIHADLLNRLTNEAAKSADHVLRMCIRALDYLPPVDVRFGEFLRAIVTADADLVPDDRLNYRLAFVEAFRRRGIFNENCLSMSPGNLLWEGPVVEDPQDPLFISGEDLLSLNLELVPEYRRRDIFGTAERNRRKVWNWLCQPSMRVVGDACGERTRAMKGLLVEAGAPSGATGNKAPAHSRPSLQAMGQELSGLGVAGESLKLVEQGAEAHVSPFDPTSVALTDELRDRGVVLERDERLDRAWEKALGIYFQRREDAPLGTIRASGGGLAVEVNSVRTTRRAGPDGQDLRQLVVEVTQRRQGFYEPKEQAKQDQQTRRKCKNGDFIFRGGATLIIDLRDGSLRYIIRKSIDDEARLARQREFLTTPLGMSFTYDRSRSNEPFAMLHRH
jgi:quinol monooxygenase YgiN